MGGFATKRDEGKEIGRCGRGGEVRLVSSGIIFERARFCGPGTHEKEGAWPALGWIGRKFKRYLAFVFLGKAKAPPDYRFL